MGKHPGLFDDLTKRSSDLLTKEFPSEKQENKFVWKGVASNDVNLETSIAQKKDGSTVGTFAPKYKHKDWDTTFSAELTTKKDFKAEVVTEELLGVEGLRTKLTAESHSASKIENFATLELQYKHELATLTTSADFGKEDGTTLKGAVVLGSQGFALGASSAYHLGLSQLKDLSSSLSYKSTDFDIAAFGNVKDGRNEVGANYFHDVNGDMRVGAEAVFDVNGSTNAPKLTFATQYAFDRDTTLKGKFDTDGRLSLSYIQNYKRSRFILSSTIDTNNLSGKNSSVFGFTLDLS